MKSTSIAFLIVAAATFAVAASAWADPQTRSRSATPRPDQARLTVPQAVTIAEVLGNGSLHKLEWEPREGVYEIKLATANGQRREMRIDAYGGRVIDDTAR